MGKSDHEAVATNADLLHAMPVFYVKSTTFLRMIPHANIIRAIDGRSGLSDTLYDGPAARNPGSQKVQMVFKFDPTKPELAVLCGAVERHKGSCTPPPTEILEQYVPRLTTLKQASQLTKVSLKQARRDLSDKRSPLLPLGGSTVISRGQVDLRNFAETVARDRSRLSVALRFRQNCLAHDLLPQEVLPTILNATFRPADAPTACDMDLTQAAMHLAVDPESDFLAYFGGSKPADGGFASGLNDLLAGRMVPTDTKQRSISKSDFQKTWRAHKLKLRDHLHQMESIVQRNLLTGEPAYLEKLADCEIPNWARESVSPFQVTPRIRDILIELHQMAMAAPTIQAQIGQVLVAIEQLRPTIIRPARSAKRRDAETAERIEELSELIKDAVGSRNAKCACWAALRRMHPDRIREVRQACSPNWLGGARDKSYSRALINRIFQAGRSIQF